MADGENEFERPRKVPRTLKEKDSGKRLIVILENASLEAVKVGENLTCSLHVSAPEAQVVCFCKDVKVLISFTVMFSCMLTLPLF